MEERPGRRRRVDPAAHGRRRAGLRSGRSRTTPRSASWSAPRRIPTVDEVALQAADENGPEGIPALAIADADTREFLGGIGLYRVNLRHGHAEVGFWLTPAARGRGIATRAVRLITDWAFDDAGFDRVELTTTPDNDATRALALKLGFKEEGTMRQRNFERGRRVDVVMFAVLKDEWRA